VCIEILAVLGVALYLTLFLLRDGMEAVKGEGPCRRARVVELFLKSLKNCRSAAVL